MKRNLLWLLTVLLLASFHTAEAQQPKKVWRIGLSHVGLDHVPPPLETLRKELKKLGYEEGKNIHLDWRNLPDEEAAHATAREFVRNRVDLIVAFESRTGSGCQGRNIRNPSAGCEHDRLWRAR